MGVIWIDFLFEQIGHLGDTLHTNADFRGDRGLEDLRLPKRREVPQSAYGASLVLISRFRAKQPKIVQAALTALLVALRTFVLAPAPSSGREERERSARRSRAGHESCADLSAATNCITTAAAAPDSAPGCLTA